MSRVHKPSSPADLKIHIKVQDLYSHTPASAAIGHNLTMYISIFFSALSRKTRVVYCYNSRPSFLFKCLLPVPYPNEFALQLQPIIFTLLSPAVVLHTMATFTCSLFLPGCRFWLFFIQNQSQSLKPVQVRDDVSS